MSNHSEENYLDQLLNSVGHGQQKKEKKEAELTPREKLERDIMGDKGLETGVRAKDEEEFLREFEQELLQDEIPDYMNQFNDDGSLMSEQEQRNNSELDSSLDEMLDHMPHQLEEEEIKVDEDAQFEGDLPEKVTEEAAEEVTEENALDSEGLEKAVDAFDEKMDDVLASEAEEGVQELPLTEDGTLDLSGMGDSDLMDMLSGDEELSDLGDMLSDQEEGKPIEGEDSIGNFAEAEMNAVEQATDPKPAEEPKKLTFLQKLSKFFFGADEDEDKVVILEGDSVDVSELSEENQKILKELEAAGDTADDNKKKKKKEKKKKEKKKKEPKPKKEKKKKEPKPKKEKKPKEVDNTPPLPKGPVIAIAILGASLFGLVMLGTSLLGYQNGVKEAQAFYDEENYTEGFEKLQGLKVKKKDKDLYNRLSALAPVSRKYEAYLVFDSNGREDLALDSLVCAFGRYDINKKYAKEYGCEDELKKMGKKISKTLRSKYQMSGKEALSLYSLRNRDDYTRKLRSRMDELGVKQ